MGCSHVGRGTFLAIYPFNRSHPTGIKQHPESDMLLELSQHLTMRSDISRIEVSFHRINKRFLFTVNKT